MSTTGPMRRRRSPGMRANLLLGVISFVGALLIAELALRTLGVRPLYEAYSKPSLLWVYDPLLGWSHQPGARDAYVGPRPWPVEFRAEVSINSLGLRGPEIPPPAPDETRILFLGDSMVAGFEVAYEETFVARIGDLLSARLGRPVRTIDAGVRGYGTDQSYLYYRERGRLLRPDLVVLFHSGNDPVDNMTLHEMRRPFGKPALQPLDDGRLELVNQPVPSYDICSEVVLDGNFEVRRCDGAIGRLFCHAQMALFDHSALFSILTISIPWDQRLLQSLYYVGNPHTDQLVAYSYRDAGDDASRRLTMATIDALILEVERNGAAFLLTGEPLQLRQVHLDEVRGSGGNVHVIQSLANRSQLEVRWQHDSHLNPEGHRLVADELADVLEPLLRSRRSMTGRR